uniref:Uncharacterized protein n=1 Tax=Rhizophora mucronata TaxID=61149 RepID=A0A2P2NU05_RHIMU
MQHFSLIHRQYYKSIACRKFNQKILPRGKKIMLNLTKE